MLLVSGRVITNKTPTIPILDIMCFFAPTFFFYVEFNLVQPTEVLGYGNGKDHCDLHQQENTLLRQGLLEGCVYLFALGWSGKGLVKVDLLMRESC